MTTKTRPAALNPLQVFGAGVRAERTARGYSQEAFADHIGIDRSYMGGVERGERNLSLTNIMRIVAGLEMKPSEFFRYLDGAGGARAK
jgi:transcriptional regulator with XRE-family HTH domain